MKLRIKKKREKNVLKKKEKEKYTKFSCTFFFKKREGVEDVF